jgi:hypothetical protein
MIIRELLASARRPKRCGHASAEASLFSALCMSRHACWLILTLAYVYRTFPKTLVGLKKRVEIYV